MSISTRQLVGGLLFVIAIVAGNVWIYITRFAQKPSLESSISVDEALGQGFEEQCSVKASQLFNRFKQRQLKFQSSVKSFLNNETTPDVASLRVIMWECTASGVGCGGLGSRFDGMITAFMLAIITDRAYIMRFHVPGCLADWYSFADSQLESWNTTDGMLALLQQSSPNATYITWGDNWHYSTETIGKTPLDQVFETDIVFFVTNMPYAHHIILNSQVKEEAEKEGWTQFSKEDLYGCLWKYLLHPTPALQKHLDAFFNQWKDFYIIGIQIRTGGDGAWQDPSRVPHSEAEKFFQCAKEIEEQVGQPAKFFLTTDSDRVRHTALEQHPDKIVSTNGTIMHVDRPQSAHFDDEGFFSTVLDHAILTRTHHLVISRSSFGESASLAGHKNSHVYPFKGQCRLENAMKSTWQWPSR